MAAHSLAVHGDTSLLHLGQGHAAKPFLAFGHGDTIGVLVDRVQDTIELSKNGLRIGVARRGVPVQPLYPAVGFDAQSSSVQFNFGSVPFRCACTVAGPRRVCAPVWRCACEWPCACLRPCVTLHMRMSC